MMNYIKTKVAGVLTGIVACVTILVMSSPAMTTWKSDGECVLFKPLQISDHVIKTEGHPGLFGGSLMEVYCLWYKGKIENSGEDCTQRVRVTEKEYERQIYGRRR